MKHGPQDRRMLTLLGIVLAAFAGLGYRLVDLQVLRHEELSPIAQQNTQQEMLLEPRRGDILDIRGNLLATSIPVRTICADPSLLGDRVGEVAHLLAPLLQDTFPGRPPKPPQAELEAKLRQQLSLLRRNDRGEMVTNRYVRLKQKVPVETWQKIQTAMLGIRPRAPEKTLKSSQLAFYKALREKAVFSEETQIRSYPNGALAAHVLGCAVSEEREVEDKPISQLVGLDGIELTLNTELAGVRGWRRTEADRSRRELVPLREQDVPPHDGAHVVLTIDSVIQHILETELAEGMEKYSPISICGLVLRPRTGEILAMATLPNYDPNRPSEFSLEARRNRILTDAPEPGSTFKIVVISGALNDGLVKLTDVFDCENGQFPFAGRVLHDHEPYSKLTVADIISKSSNIGAAKVGILMKEPRLYEYIRNFGFGSPTGIPLPVESRGRCDPVEKWSKVSIAQIPMGQGIMTTRLQMMMAMCAIANRGMLMRPMLVNRLENRDHDVIAQFAPQRIRQVISEGTAAQMIAAMKKAVTPEGTAAKAALEHYTVAGKTGTAQKAEHGAYVHGKYFSSFIGFFPADNPEICISVMLDEPKTALGYYGGQTAAPVFHQIAERSANYLNIRPEDPGAPESVSLSPDYRPQRTPARRTP